MSLKESQFIYFEELDKTGQILAKTDGVTLQEHSSCVLQNAIQIIEKLYLHESLKGYDDLIKELIRLIAYIHDAGKADKRWQQDIIKDGKEKSRIPHPLLSLPIAKEYLERHLKIENQEIKEVIINLGLIAIACHHSPISNDKYEGYNTWDTDYIFEFQGSSRPYEIFDEARDKIIPNQSKKMRYLYVLTNGILTLADWIGSSKEARYKEFDTIGLDTKIDSYFKKEKKSQPYPYQNSAKDIQSDLIIQLPTGKGKTETALLWLSGKETSKVFYTLPTVTTVDAMKKRLIKIFNKDEVTFSHHLLELSLAKEDQLTEEELFINKHLISPVVVTTIDRLLLAMMNFKRYPVVESMLNNASIIIDEIHSYTPFTLSLIIETLRYLKEYHNVRLCIMSATLPEIIREELQNLSDYTPLFQEREIKEFYSKLSRTRIKKFYKGELLENNLEIIRDAIKKYQKVLVVVNTVSRAQEIFSNIKDTGNTKKILFHSRFTYGDRLNKQDEINQIEENKKLNKVLLIATQIVEVSLDIDFDVLFTEIAPIDALIQRAGRINRKGKKEICDIHIFDVEDEKGFLPYTKEQIEEARKILNNVRIRSEMDYLEMNEEFYKKIAPFYRRELEEDKLQDFINQIYEKHSIDKVLQTRDGFLTIPVVPVCFEDMIEKIENEIKQMEQKIKNIKDKQKQSHLKNQRLNLIAKKMKFFVPMAFYNVKDTLISRDIPFVQLKYNPQIGILRDKDDEVKSIIII